MIEISIVIPCKNEEQYIAQCLLALEQQTLPRHRYEIICVDNGSTDLSREIIERFPSVILLSESRPGPYHARNTALARACGQIIAFTDADCIVSGEWLETIVSSMSNGADIVLGSRAFPADASPPLRLIEAYENKRIEYLVKNRLRQYYYGYTNNMACWRSLFMMYGLFDVTHHTGDTEFIHRVMCEKPDAIIAYNRLMNVMHCEMTRVSVWLIKNIFYAMHNRVISAAYDYKAISFKVKYAILRETLRTHPMSAHNRMLFYIVLMVGDGVYKWGMVTGFMRSLFRCIRKERA